MQKTWRTVHGVEENQETTEEEHGEKRNIKEDGKGKVKGRKKRDKDKGGVEGRSRRGGRGKLKHKSAMCVFLCGGELAPSERRSSAFPPNARFPPCS